MEHRCGHRRAVEVAVIIRTRAGLAGRATVCDVSASGARVDTTLPLGLHSVVLLQFTAKEEGKSRQRVTLEAEVVRLTDSGFGIEWAEFAPEGARILYAPHVDTRFETETLIPTRRQSPG